MSFDKHACTEKLKLWPNASKLHKIFSNAVSQWDVRLRKKKEF